MQPTGITSTDHVAVEPKTGVKRPFVLSEGLPRIPHKLATIIRWMNLLIWLSSCGITWNLSAGFLHCPRPRVRRLIIILEWQRDLISVELVPVVAVLNSNFPGKMKLLFVYKTLIVR
jgi:hypothetical protein